MPFGPKAIGKWLLLDILHLLVSYTLVYDGEQYRYNEKQVSDGDIDVSTSKRNIALLVDLFNNTYYTQLQKPTI